MAQPETTEERYGGGPPVDGAPAELEAGLRAVSRRVLGLSWPVFVENLLQTGVGAVDTLMVSVLGTAALAGVGTSVVLLFIVQSAIMAVAMGGSVLVAHAVGARDGGLLRRSAGQTLVLGLILSVGPTVVGTVFAEQFVAGIIPGMLTGLFLGAAAVLVVHLRGWGTPEDVGRAVTALALDYLPYSTGETINVDGGFHVRRL